MSEDGFFELPSGKLDEAERTLSFLKRLKDLEEAIKRSDSMDQLEESDGDLMKRRLIKG